ncbi:unnamed protein product [Brachionus calyciflorus]|uniref:MULE transposase domain-containing protein n=1 Tax=Brachionus calyciflorus TaxID=104777 RepID=A0A814NI55_9BILA|nr:unnamed protein product [Brachionus calyciflorus]
MDLSFLDSQVEHSVDEISEKISSIKIQNDHDWSLHHTQKNNFYKLYSNGFCYVVDKPKIDLISEATKIYWRCEFYNECGGRGISNGLIPPFKETNNHHDWHKPKPESKEFLESKETFNELVKKSKDAPRALIRDFQPGLSENCIYSWSKKNAIRQKVIRTRNCQNGLSTKNFKLLHHVVIDEELKFTYKKNKFYFGDSGPTDKNRVIFFTTDQNLKLLSTYRDWYCDGTFSICPSPFKQVYTIHIIIRGTTLPMVYAFLPNKKQVTYKKLFKLLAELITMKPLSVNCDF